MESHGLKRRSGAPPRAEVAHLRLLVGRALALVRRAVGVNSKMLKKWVFAYVNKAAEGKDTLNWLMDYATPGFFDDSGTYDSSYGNMTKGEMDMYQTKSTISSLSAQPFQPDDPLVTTNDPWCCVGSKTALRGRGSRARPISLPVTARLSRYGIA